MNEKVNFYLVVILVVVAILLGGTAGFLIGGGNFGGPVEPEHTDRELAATIGSLRTELNHERAITGRIRGELDREREIAGRIRREQGEERILIAAALKACRSAGGGLQGVIAKMEILNNLIRDLERRAGRDGDLSGDE